MLKIPTKFPLKRVSSLMFWIAKGSGGMCAKPTEEWELRQAITSNCYSKSFVVHFPCSVCECVRLPVIRRGSSICLQFWSDALRLAAPCRNAVSFRERMMVGSRTDVILHRLILFSCIFSLIKWHIVAFLMARVNLSWSPDFCVWLIKTLDPMCKPSGQTRNC